MIPSRLAETMAMPKGEAITAMVDQLEKAGYLRRIRDVRDRRQVLVEIIWEEQLHRLMAYCEPVGDVLAGVLADHTDEELDRIAEFTARANNVLDAVVSAFSKPPAALRQARLLHPDWVNFRAHLVDLECTQMHVFVHVHLRVDDRGCRPCRSAASPFG